MMLFWGFSTLILVAMLLEAFCIVRGLWYVKVTFPQKLLPDFRRRQKARGGGTPKIALFVPCKGASSDLEGNVLAMLRQDYPDYTLFCITESETDAAAPILTELASGESRLHHVVAGPVSRCCQKNHNLLKGIDYAAENGLSGDIYVFADMDIHPEPDWLTNITLPLADPETFAVSGFRSLIPGSDRFPEHLHAAFSALQALAMTEKAYAAMWGGSMALMREAFDRYEVYHKWSTAMVDDMSLTWIIHRHGLRRVFSPDCLVSSRETYPELKRVMDWMVRQTQYAAIYLRPYTAFGLCLNSLLALLMLSCPVALILNFCHAVSPVFALATLLIYFLISAGIGLLGVFVKQKGLAFHWFFYAPLFLVLGALCGWIGFFSKRLRWANILYRFDRSGEIQTVEQMVLPENR